MKAIITVILLLGCIQGFAQGDSLSTRMHRMHEVQITASGARLAKHVESTQMGKTEIPVSMLLKTPAIAGEPDIIKALQLTPGVKRGTEGNIGMFVRGGGNDENLILLDGAPVYNAGHLLGFFSIFNSSTLKDAQLYKSCFPAQYGGRLSSVLDVRTKEGSLADYKAAVSIGAIASSATVQGPILKDKLSFIVSGRRTYIDKVFSYIPYHFYDGNAKLTYVLDEKNRFYLSGYKGEDQLKTKPTSTDGYDQPLKSNMHLGNESAVLRWNNIGDKHTSDISVSYSKFNYNISGSMDSNSLAIRSAIRDYGIKGDIKSINTGDHKLGAGFSLTNHFFNPNIVSSNGPLVERFGNRGGKKIYTTEAAAYISDDYRINDALQLNAGLRISGTAAEEKAYANLEPRVGLRYLLDDRNSVKASYARMAQYMHLVSSSSLALPTDLWYPVTKNVAPGISDQVSLGYYHNVPSLGLILSAEVYYKWLQNLVEYREGALLILNDNYENELVRGKGRSYGLELFAGKTTGRFTGWVGYSLSFAHRRFDSLNNGKEYYARHDRRHDVSLVTMYDITSRWAASSSVVYATGSPFTGQSSQYIVPKPDLAGFEILPAYTGRNELRMSAAFRIDLDLAYKFSLGKRIKGDAHISVYNLLNRTQPHNVTRVYDEATSTFKYRQNGLFGTITTGTINFNL
ncbi:TonB-dependent receptor plug domain-containing protein [Polluticoccus soli]|uniref:TonB-dependent receptor plug domain-containing protein n=1 Tax=Polluticoccus soli TaxID=3034150 RepID=UPI0023E2C782|nr:TonB-dependent receptor [Flavipsychrobacter sp. JY13-12]